MYKLVIILRYLRKQRITLFPIAGVAIAVAALVGVMALADGLEAEFTRQMRFVLPDLDVSFMVRGGLASGDKAKAEEIIRRVESVQEVAAVCQIASLQARIIVKTRVAGSGRIITRSINGYVWGVDLARAEAVTALAGNLRYGSRSFETSHSDPWPRVIVSARLAGRRSADAGPDKDWGILERGDVIHVAGIAPLDEITATPAVVQDVFLDATEPTLILMPLDSVFALLGQPPYVERLHVRLKGSKDADFEAARRHITEALAPYVGSKSIHFGTWQDFVGPMMNDFVTLRRVMGVVFFFLYLVSGFVIAAVLAMTALSKTRDIGILRAMGSSRPGIAALYLAYGGAIGLAGAAAGLVVALACLQKADLMEAAFTWVTGVSKPAEMEWTHTPWLLTWRTALEGLGTAISMGIVASVLPAIRAARFDPIAAVHRD